jgi:DNA invertase Pin-like site-specific DNA recombinase
MRVAIYARVSTDGQSVNSQLEALRKVARRRGWRVVKEYTDAGISGAKGRDQRPALDAMLKGAVRGEFDLVAAWSVDRLGRSLQHLVNGLSDLQAAGIGLYLHQQAIDTTTAEGKAMFGMLGVFAEFERSLITARVRNGIKHAKKHGTKTGRPFGRPKIEYRDRQKILRLHQKGQSQRSIAKDVGVSRGTVQNVLKEA